MMSESSHAESSPWAPYLAALPRQLDSLVFWSEDELSELQASTVINKIGKAGAEEQYHHRIDKLGISGASLTSFHHMASLIMAYAFDIPEGQIEEEESDEELQEEEEEKTILTMIPLADMLNADADRNNARLMCDSEDLEMRAIKAISKNEEILNDYGQLPRSDLLRRYGYVTDNYRQYDVAEISSDSITSAFTAPTADHIKLTMPQLKARIELAEREGVFEDSYDIMRGDSDGPCLSDELVAFLWILCVNKETFDALHKSEMSLPSRNKLTTAMVGSVSVQLLNLRQKEYPTTVEEDAAILDAGNLPPRKLMAVQVRKGEKEVLREAIEEANTFHADGSRMRGETTSSTLSKRARDNATTATSKRQRR